MSKTARSDEDRKVVGFDVCFLTCMIVQLMNESGARRHHSEGGLKASSCIIDNIHIYVCMHVCMYVCMYVCMWTSTCKLCWRMLLCVCACVHVACRDILRTHDGGMWICFLLCEVGISMNVNQWHYWERNV